MSMFLLLIGTAIIGTGLHQSGKVHSRTMAPQMGVLGPYWLAGMAVLWLGVLLG